MLTGILHRLLNVLKVPLTKSIIIVTLLILLIWFIGPYIKIAEISILSGTNNRLIIVLFTLLCWSLYEIINFKKEQKSQMGEYQQNEKQNKPLDRKQLKNEIKSLNKCLKSAIKIITTSNYYGNRSRSRYTLPWYLMLGAQHSGKTSLLLNSGLKFTLNDQKDRLVGQVQSTNQCEIFYGNEAVFLDIPGSYTDCKSGSFTYKIWTALLKRLIKLRSANPLNGIIICVSMREIITTDQAKREEYARTIRTRLSEIFKRLHCCVPMYLVFTKCDIIPGFTQFFNHLSRSEREQIFGCPSTSKNMEPGSIRTGIKDLLHIINGQIIAKIHQERDVATRGDMFRFPQEISLLGPQIEDFIADSFGPSRYHRPVMLRGFFLTSALSAHDLMDSVAHNGEQSFQTGYRASAGECSRGYFIQNLFNKFIIPDSKIVVEDKDRNWSLIFRKYGIQLSALIIFLVSSVLLSVSFTNNFMRLEKLNTEYSIFAPELKANKITADSKAELSHLEQIANTTTIYTISNDSHISYGLGLYQGKRFEKATNTAYLGLLNTRLLPSLRIAAMAKIDRSLNNLTELKSTLKAYLMLCQPDRIQKKFITDYLERQWSDQYQGQANVQRSLSNHWNYLLTHGITATDPDIAIVERARKALLKIPLSSLVYQRLQEEALENGKQAFSFHSAIGETPFLGDTYLIPYLYTRNGYEEYLIKRCPDIIKNITDEDWIYGGSSMVLSKLDVSKIQKEVRTMYFRDYAQHWNQSIQNLQVRTPSSIADARNLAEQMTTGIPPTVLVIREFKKNTNLMEEYNENGSVGTLAISSKNVEKNEVLRDSATIKQYFQPIRNLLLEDGNPGQPLKVVSLS